MYRVVHLEDSRRVVATLTSRVLKLVQHALGLGKCVELERMGEGEDAVHVEQSSAQRAVSNGEQSTVVII